jgi:hypothetical protein
MLTYLVGGLSAALLCGGWVVVQRWITAREPDLVGPEGGCTGCGGCGGGSCASRRSEGTGATPRRGPPGRGSAQI